MTSEFDVIIPVYRPDGKLTETLSALSGQAVRPREILLLITRAEGEDTEALAAELQKKDERIRTRIIERKEFDHALTRNLGVNETKGTPFFLLMTQDAVPADVHLSEQLLKALEENPDAAAAYARQIAGRDASTAEKCLRRFNYPEKSSVKSVKDKERLGIKTYFCSNVCAMYRRDIFEKYGGFEAPAIFNEDMVYAAKVINAGFEIVYCAEARVYHTHEYTLAQQFRRSFDNGVSHACRPDVFRDTAPAKEGGRYVSETMNTLMRVGQGAKIPYFWLQCGMRLIGFQAGKHFKLLPAKLRSACSMDRMYWKRT